MPEVSTDGKTYKLKLRKGLKYSDGSPVKASDFEHTIKRVLNLESGGSAFYLGIEGAQEYVEARQVPTATSRASRPTTRPATITIKLTEPDGTFSNVLAMWFAGLVPGDTPFKNLTKDPPPGVGAYKVTESVPNRQFVIEKNPNFPDLGPDIPPGKIDKITTKIVKSAQRQAQDVITGELDYMQDPPPADLKPEVKAKYSDRYKEHHDRVDVLLLHEHADRRRSTTRRSARRSTAASTSRRSPASSRASCARAARSCRPACRATTRRSTSRTARGATRTSRRTSRRRGS